MFERLQIFTFSPQKIIVYLLEGIYSWLTKIHSSKCSKTHFVFGVSLLTHPLLWTSCRFESCITIYNLFHVLHRKFLQKNMWWICMYILCSIPARRGRKQIWGKVCHFTWGDLSHGRIRLGPGSRNSADGRSPAGGLTVHSQHGGRHSWEYLMAYGSWKKVAHSISNITIDVLVKNQESSN